MFVDVLDILDNEIYRITPILQLGIVMGRSGSINWMQLNMG